MNSQQTAWKAQKTKIVKNSKKKEKIHSVPKNATKTAKLRHYSLFWQKNVKIFKDFTPDRIFYTNIVGTLQCFSISAHWHIDTLKLFPQNVLLIFGYVLKKHTLFIISSFVTKHLLILINNVLCNSKALNNDSNKWLLLSVNPKTRFLDV